MKHFIITTEGKIRSENHSDNHFKEKVAKYNICIFPVIISKNTLKDTEKNEDPNKIKLSQFKIKKKLFMTNIRISFVRFLKTLQKSEN